MSNKHRERLKATFDAGRWFLVRRDFHLIMGIEEAHVLSFLCSVGAMEGQDWFRCSAARVCKEFNLSTRTHERIMKKIYKTKLLRWRQFGVPGRRHLFIDYELIESLIDAKKLDIGIYPNPGTTET